MNSFQRKARDARRRLRIALPAVIIFAAACASTPPPSGNLQAAQQAIANAERVDASTHAGVELGEARGKLTAAQHEVEQKHMVAGAQLADEARVAAELAAAKTGAAKAHAANEDLRKSTATLVDEMQRKTGDSR